MPVYSNNSYLSKTYLQNVAVQLRVELQAFRGFCEEIIVSIKRGHKRSNQFGSSVDQFSDDSSGARIPFEKMCTSLLSVFRLRT